MQDRKNRPRPRADHTITAERPAPQLLKPGRLRTCGRVLTLLLITAYAGFSIYRAVQHVIWLLFTRDPVVIKAIPLVLAQTEADVLNGIITRIVTYRTVLIAAQAALALLFAMGCLMFFCFKKPLLLRIALRIQAWAAGLGALFVLALGGYLTAVLIALRASLLAIALTGLISLVCALGLLIISRFCTHVRRLPTVGGRTRRPYWSVRCVQLTTPFAAIVLLAPAAVVLFESTIYDTVAEFISTVTPFSRDAIDGWLGSGFTGVLSMYSIDMSRSISAGAACLSVLLLSGGLNGRLRRSDRLWSREERLQRRQEKLDRKRHRLQGKMDRQRIAPRAHLGEARHSPVPAQAREVRPAPSIPQQPPQPAHVQVRAIHDDGRRPWGHGN